MKSTFYVTTPIYYANAQPHLGHLYTTLIADTLTRYMRQRGKTAFFLTGTDEHGLNIERAAEAAGVPVADHVEGVVAKFQAMISDFHLNPDRFIRTTSAPHKKGATALYNALRDAGYIYKGEYEGLYCAGCNQYYTETEAVDLNGHKSCPTHETALDSLKEESYFFRLSAFQEPLLKHYETHPEFIQPKGRYNEIVNFVSGGLQDLSISRASVSWGIPLPDDNKHTLYVWLDALSNYITALGYGNDTYKGFDTFWPADLQIVGKDILRFHTVYWPAFLMAAGLALPTTVYAHGMWISDGRKMSKSLGNTIELPDLRAHFSLDTIRYFCMREMAFGSDADFNYPALIARHNGDLAGGLGNLASRSLTLVKSGLGGQIPAVKGDDAASAEVREAAGRARQTFTTRMEAYEFHRALEGAWELIGATDRYIAQTKPWALAKDPQARAELEQVLAVAAESLRHLAVMLSPVMPEAMAGLWAQLGLAGQPSDHDPMALQWGEGPARTLGKMKGLFPRLNSGKLMAKLAGDAQKAPEQKPAKGKKDKKKDKLSMPEGFTPSEGADMPLDYATFLKTDIRVGIIRVAEPHPKADRLLRLEIDIGEPKPRQICAGIADSYKPEALVGERVMVVANLAPRKLRGLVSQGMVLAADGPDGSAVLIHPPDQAPPGSRVR